MWRRLILALGLIGAVGLVAVAVAGYQLSGVGDEQVPGHVLGGFGAFLFLAFVDLWLLLFLAASGWAARATVRERQVASTVPADLAAASRRAWPLALIGLLSTAAAIVTGALTFTGAMPATAHAGAVALALLAQCGAFWRGNQTLLEHDRQFARLASEAP
jgi:hypothetical protein